MATERKYLSLDKLSLYDGKIKALMDTKDAAILASAKEHAEGLADNYDPAGSAATALADAKTYADGKDAAIAAAKKAGDDAQADVDALEVKVGTVAEGKTVVGLIGEAQAAADAAQGDVDALETKVGEIPADSGASTVIGYVDKKTTGIAKQSELDEVKAQVNTNKTDIATIKGDYLKAADKTKLQGNIDTVGGKVTTLIGSDADKSVRTIANEELAAQLIPENAKESLDTLQEIAAWIQAHPDDATAMNQAITALQNLVGTIPEGVTATNIVAYIQEVVAAEKTRAEGVESGLDSRLDDVEAKLGTGTGSVTEQIATAKSEAISTAAADATEKANQAKTDAVTEANSYTDTEVAKVKAIADANTAEIAKKADTTALTALTERVTTAEGEIDTLQTEMDAVETKAAANETAITNANAEIAKKANASDLTALETRVAANETAIAAFVEISEAEINALFA